MSKEAEYIFSLNRKKNRLLGILAKKYRNPDKYAKDLCDADIILSRSEGRRLWHQFRS